MTNGTTPPPVAGPTGAAITPLSADILIREIRIQDFRGLRDFCTSFKPLSVLVGENNVGKTSLLQALSVFFGTMKATEDDLYVAPDGKRAQRFEIDVRFEPESGLEFNDAVRTRIGPAVQLSNGTAADYYAVRAIGKVNPD